MPIEIREVHINVSVDDQATPVTEQEVAQNLEDKLDELLESVVQKVLSILREKSER